MFREQAEKGSTVVIESREGVKFVFHRIGAAPRPRRVETPLPREITDKWNVDSPATIEDSLVKGHFKAVAISQERPENRVRF